MLLPADSPAVLRNSCIFVRYPVPGRYCYPASDASLRYSSPTLSQETYAHFWTVNLPADSLLLPRRSQDPMEAHPCHTRNVPPASALQSSSYPNLKSCS